MATLNLLALALITQYPEPVRPIELICTLNGSTSTVVVDEGTGRITHNDVDVSDPRVGRNTIAYSFTTKGGTNRFAIVINRVDGHMTVAVTPRIARAGAGSFRMSGSCRRFTARAF